jgi:hypothetical protein
MYGEEKTYQEIVDKDVEEEVSLIKFEFYIDNALLAIIILMYALTKKK